MPRTVVHMKPRAWRPGITARATKPATKPIKMVQRNDISTSIFVEEQKAHSSVAPQAVAAIAKADVQEAEYKTP